MSSKSDVPSWPRIALILGSLVVAVLFGWAVLYAFGKFLLEGWS